MNSRQHAHVAPLPEDRGPLVSIGMPVRNGAAFLDEAMRLVVEQTHRNIEIIVSDNASDDGSTAIIERYARADARIRVFTQPRVLTAFENFRFVFEQASGDYFMWAACDDRRSHDNVERLLAAIQAHPEASLVFGDVAEFSDFSCWDTYAPILYPFETGQCASRLARVLRYSRIGCIHVYGIIRSTALRSYRWIDIDNGPDIPLLIHLSLVGEYVRAEGGCFYRFAPTVPKTLEARAEANSLHRLKRFPELRLAWACAQAANRAARLQGASMPKLPTCTLVYANRHWRWIKPWLFGFMPRPLVAIYRKWFKRAHV